MESLLKSLPPAAIIATEFDDDANPTPNPTPNPY